jgi:hypothetical protein
MLCVHSVKGTALVFIYFLLSWISLIGFGKQEKYGTESFINEEIDV